VRDSFLLSQQLQAGIQTRGDDRYLRTCAAKQCDLAFRDLAAAHDEAGLLRELYEYRQMVHESCTISLAVGQGK
jgi:hypothetical protein